MHVFISSFLLQYLKIYKKNFQEILKESVNNQPFNSMTRNYKFDVKDIVMDKATTKYQSPVK